MTLKKLYSQAFFFIIVINRFELSGHCIIGWADLELFSKMDLLLMPKVEYPIG